MTIEERISSYIEDHRMIKSSIAKDMGMSLDAFYSIINKRRKMTANEFKSFCEAENIDPQTIFTYGD